LRGYRQPKIARPLRRITDRASVANRGASAIGSKPISSSPDSITSRLNHAVIRRLQALVIERLACESWIGRRSVTALELGPRISLATNASPIERRSPNEQTRQVSQRKPKYPFLEATFRAPLRADRDRDGLFIGRSSRCLPRPAKAQSSTSRKSKFDRELYNYY